ncbi:MAG TPA: CarD family transcriptional regulator, partial [Flavisolibacter sp.]|nr:CarD family transcriptional regulator [Flavisolibacter sp.]
MNIEELLGKWNSSPRIFQLTDRLSFSQPQKIHLKNLLGSSSQFVASSVFQHPSCNHLNHVFICNDAEDAAYFHNTIESLTQALNVYYFPSSFKSRKNYALLNSSHVMLRTEALTKFSSFMGNRAGALVTYPDAVFEKVVVSKIISSNIINIKSGDVINTDDLYGKLVDYGFERTDFVYEPGQFAVRGGIIDIYSFGNEKPYRLELFGNDVDSIRIIDPETQLSERRLLQVSIIPNVDSQFSDEEKVSLLDFLPDNTIIWIQDEDVLTEKLAAANEDLNSFLQQQVGETSSESDEKYLKRHAERKDFIIPDHFFESLYKKHVVYFGYQKPLHSVFEIEFNIKEQPAFNRQFDMLIEDLKAWEKKQFQINLFAENPKQLERLYTIFKDLKEEISFNPIATAIHEGFIDEDLKLVCYTDHQIFQRYHKYKVKQAYNKNKALTLRALRELQPGDFVTHIDHGVGVYSGLQKIEVNGKMQEAVRIIYKDSDILY